MRDRGVRQAWLDFLGRERVYPREIMVPSTWRPGGRKRWVERNPFGYVAALEAYGMSRDVWVGMRAPQDYYLAKPFHNRLWLETDGPKGDLEYARLAAQSLSNLCVTYFGVMPYAQFSGNRGFHLHLEHMPVYGMPEQYRTAIRTLVEEAGLDPDVDVDMNVVGNTRAMPRPPYTMNTKDAVQKGRVLYTVPVNLAWSVDRILAASVNQEVQDVRIPFSEQAHVLLQELVDEAPVESAPVKEITEAGARRLCEEAAAFVERIAPYVRDGRKRILRSLAVPAYLHLAGSESGAMKACESFVEKSGAVWGSYRQYVDGQIRSARKRDGTVIYPMRVQKFVIRHPEILRYIQP